MSDFVIKTPRLGLRNWIDSDVAPFAEMNSDSQVMRFFPRMLTEEESAELIERLKQHYETHGFTYFAVEELESNEFIGFVGLKHQTFESPYTPNIDIGWRLKPTAWGKGYATEAAKACLAFAASLEISEIYSHCPAVNKPSESVMVRLGMEKVGEFNHSALEATPELNPCVAYRIIIPKAENGR